MLGAMEVEECTDVLALQAKLKKAATELRSLKSAKKNLITARELLEAKIIEAEEDKASGLWTLQTQVTLQTVADTHTQ